jgi:hypothetical protein
VTGQLGYLRDLISTIVRVSPFRKWIAKPDPKRESFGTPVSSAYVNCEEATSPCENLMYESSVSALDNGESVEMTNPFSRVKLDANPLNLAETDLSADTKYANTGMPSVTNLCSIKPASSGEIIFSLMAEDCGPDEARFWCKRLGLLA